MIRLALFEPDIPGNVGACMRLCACMDTPLEIIEPTGFIFDDKRLRRAGIVLAFGNDGGCYTQSTNSYLMAGTPPVCYGFRLVKAF